MADDIPHLEAPADEVPAANDNVTVDGGAVAQSIGTPQKDTAMPDAPIEPGSSPAAALQAHNSVPARTGTPAQGSRAASVLPDPGLSIPSEPSEHGDSTRRYLNSKVTGVLLEGMKQVAMDKPHDPLRVLGEYLIQRSKELEGTN